MSRRRTHAAHAVVTGAGSGIGRAFAAELAARGGRVVCADIDVAAAEKTAGRLPRAHAVRSTSTCGESCTAATPSRRCCESTGRARSLTSPRPRAIARTTLDACDKGRLYVLPQWDARLVWRLKRLAPATYTRAAGLMKRLTQGD